MCTRRVGQMSQAMINVELLDLSGNALSLIYAACRQCYSPTLCMKTKG